MGMGLGLGRQGTCGDGDLMHKGVGGLAVGVMRVAGGKLGRSLTSRRESENGAPVLGGFGKGLEKREALRSGVSSLTPKLVLRKIDGSVWGLEKSVECKFGQQLGSDHSEYFT